MYHQIIKIVWKNKGQNALLLLEIFISFVILAAVFAYLFNNFQKLNAPLGFETKDRWMVLFGDYYIKKDSLAYVQEVDNLRRNLDNMPEVKSHSFGNMVYPFSWNNWSSITEVNNIKLEYKLAAYDDEFNNTMEVPIVEGRWYNKPLQTNDIDEVVVNNVFKNLYFADKNIIDSVFNLNGDKKIVGIIENFKYNGEFTVEDPIAISYQS
ncbi:MAG TPA: hypothetical protein PKD85_08550, partial [Saprospiraceae bacterium]|nr:hypothetical protein [Saprospiraceae bacterium]